MTSPTPIVLLAFSIVLSFTLGCEDPSQPEVVSEIMTAKINGVRWNSTDDDQYNGYSHYDVDLQLLTIAATKYGRSSNSEVMSIVVVPYSTDSTYLLNDISIGRFVKRTVNQAFTTTATHTGYMTITSLDTVAKFASGTFAFSATDTASKSVINVTEGRFRVPFGVY